MVRRQDWTPSQFRKHFFDRLRDRRDALERQAAGSAIIEEVTPPERLWNYLEYVGSFLLEAGVISDKDHDQARAMITDYENRLEEAFPRR